MTAPCIAPPPAAPCGITATYPATPEAIPQARALARSLPPQVRNDAEIVTAELTANAVLHASTDTVTVSVEPTPEGGVHIEVSDADPVHMPQRTDALPTETHGRGLVICMCLCSDLHCEAGPDGKTVCADIACGGMIATGGEDAA